ncbi:hypothetical protein OESDEN_07554, partial [Oesophagostomum dentatum]
MLGSTTPLEASKPSYALKAWISLTNSSQKRIF